MKSVRRLAGYEKHQAENWLRDVILGGQDGLVNVLGIVLGVSAASGNNQILIAASLAAAFAEAVSMGAVAYTSTLAQRDHYLKEYKREKHEVETIPEIEREEIRQIYQRKGFSGELLEKAVATISGDKDTWIKTMMDEELGLSPIDASRVLRTSIIVGLAAVVGALVPIIPFIVLSRGLAIPTALVLSTVALFGIGVYEAKTFVGVWWKKGLQMAAIGMGAAAVGYFIGKLFQVSWQ